MTTLVFVHGACVRDGAWWWSRMVEPLAARGVASVTVALPSCGEAGGPLGDLHDDVAACRAAMAGIDGPIALLGHSYGGMVVTGAGDDDRVSRLLYLTSVMADEGESQGALLASEPAPWMRPGDDGTVGVDPDLIRERFLQDCDDEATEGAIARLTRQAVVPFTQAAPAVAWRRRPATYVVCTEDLATPADVQRRRVRGGARTIEVAAGHHPFLSHPDAFAATLADEVQRAA